MNRLLLTILLALAFAMSFSQFAHTDPKGSATQAETAKPDGKTEKTAKHNKKGNDKSADASGNQSQTAQPQPAQSADDTTLTSKDICIGTSDCEQRDIRVDNKDATMTLALDVTNRKLKISDNICKTCMNLPDTDTVIDIPGDIKLTKNAQDIQKIQNIVKQGYDKRIQQVLEAAAKKHVDDLRERCEIRKFKDIKDLYEIKEGKVDYSKLDDYKFSKNSKDDDDNTSLADSEETQSECQQGQVSKLAGVEKLTDAQKKKLSSMFNKIENRLAELSAKNPADLSESERAELESLKDFQTNTVLEGSNSRLTKMAANFWKNKMLGSGGELSKVMASYNTLRTMDPKNPATYALIQTTLNKTNLENYKSDMALAVTATGAASELDSKYKATADKIVSVQDNPDSVIRMVNDMSSKVPSSVRNAYAQGQLQNGDASAADADFNKNLQDAYNTYRMVDKNLLGEALVGQSLTIPQFKGINPSWSNQLAHFRTGGANTQGVAMGTGALNVNGVQQASPFATNSNSWANNVNSGNCFGTSNFQPNCQQTNNNQNNFQQNSFVQQPVNTGFSGNNFANTNNGFTRTTGGSNGSGFSSFSPH